MAQANFVHLAKVICMSTTKKSAGYVHEEGDWHPSFIDEETESERGWELHTDELRLEPELSAEVFLLIVKLICLGSLQ